MSEYTFSKHAIEMMTERKIIEDWVWRTLNDPENTFTKEDQNLHFVKPIAEKENRILHLMNRMENAITKKVPGA